MTNPTAIQTVLVTGGAGFIGSNFIHFILRERPACRVINYDALTYAGNLENLAGLEEGGRYQFVKGDICEGDKVLGLLREQAVDTIVHFAAESHVDRSILSGAEFVRTNVLGTQSLLEAALKAETGRFVMVSTDEVYGSLGETGLFTEETPLAPNSPYSSSKAGADLLCRAVSPHLWPAGGDNALLEQLRPLPVPGKADSADDRQGAGRRGAAGLRRRDERARLDPRRRSLRGGAGGGRTRDAGRSL